MSWIRGKKAPNPYCMAKRERASVIPRREYNTDKQRTRIMGQTALPASSSFSAYLRRILHSLPWPTLALVSTLASRCKTMDRGIYSLGTRAIVGKPISRSDALSIQHLAGNHIHWQPCQDPMQYFQSPPRLGSISKTPSC